MTKQHANNIYDNLLTIEEITTKPRGLGHTFYFFGEKINTGRIILALLNVDTIKERDELIHFFASLTDKRIIL